MRFRPSGGCERGGILRPQGNQQGERLSYVGSNVGTYPHGIAARVKGGMGEVFLGYDPRLDRRVAVKTIRAEKRLSPQLKARFLREARLLSKLGHPSICQVYDLVETPEADFLILEYVPGETLRRLAERPACGSSGSSGSARRSPPRSPPPIGRRSCTAISRRTTSWSPPRAR